MAMPLADDYPEGERRKLLAIWETAPGIYGWLATVDHKRIGIRYLCTAFFFLLIGGVEALTMRIQLAQPGLKVLSPDAYNQLFSMHGVTMIFLYALPMLSGFSNFLWPLLLGSRDMAFPRLNALSYWVYLFAGIFLYVSVPLGQAPDGGWFNYVPNTAKPYDPGINIDVFALGIIFLGISTVVGSANFIVSLLRCRAPGMSVNRLPILVWGTLTASVANLFAIPAVSLACLMLWMDRRFDTNFFDITGGGQPLMWQHLFWVFGHPWVYALVLPAMGIVSDALPVFCRRPLVGYTLVAISTVSTMLLGFGVWVHHMFATGLPVLSLSFFSAASFVIAIPSAIGVFCLDRHHLDRPAPVRHAVPVLRRLRHPLRHRRRLRLHDRFGGARLAAHRHLFRRRAPPLRAARHQRLSRHRRHPFLVSEIHRPDAGRAPRQVDLLDHVRRVQPGVLPDAYPRPDGMPRRIYTYPAELGFGGTNLVVSIGAFVFAVGILLLLMNVARSLRSGVAAGPNPWDAPTLEWSVPSPPPPYNFVTIPVVASRHPLWEDRLNETDERSILRRGMLLDEGKETLGVTALDAEPDAIIVMPDDSLLPVVLALGMAVVFGGMLVVNWWAIGVGALMLTVTLLLWMAPPARDAEERQAVNG